MRVKTEDVLGVVAALIEGELGLGSVGSYGCQIGIDGDSGGFGDAFGDLFSLVVTSYGFFDEVDGNRNDIVYVG